MSENSARKKAMKKKMNNLHVGMIVNYHSVIGGPVTSSHKVVAIERRNRQWVVFLARKSGFVSFDALSEFGIVE